LDTNNFSDLVNRPKAELTDSELQQLEAYEFQYGPMSILTTATNTQSTVIISLRNDHKLIAKVKAFDRHCNMVLENVKEFWTDINNGTKVTRERFVSKMFLRGDSVVVILKHSD